MNTKEVQEHLKVIGWPIVADGSYGPVTQAAVTDFQLGFGFRDLTIDGHAGPQTWQALTESVLRDGACAQYFKFREFKSKGNGWIKIHRTHARRLDTLRRHVGPVGIISGYRDPIHNRRVGGAPNSQHLYGNGCDIPQHWSVNLIQGLSLFAGIGIVRATGKVAHVDSRDMGPNTTGGSPKNPTIWYYG
jgi:zinc D-Ala-D-Ala carboxypeptidase